MHADGVGNIGYRAAAITTQFAPCSQQGDPRRVCLRFSASTQKPFCLLPRRSSASKLKLVTVSRATVSRYGSDYPRQTVTSDRDGTLGPQSRVPTDDVVALNSSASRPPLTTSPLTTSVVRSYEVPLWDAMKFNGPAPEIINGRLAMLGIIAAAVNEVNYSETVAQQVPHVSIRLVLMTLLVSYSSLIPILKGAKSEAFGPFTPRAELTNGRAAMLGFGILVLLENKSGVPFF